MNVKQRISLWLGAIVFSFLAIRPPWKGTWVNLEGHIRRETILGSHFVWHDFRDIPASVATYVRLDFSRLSLELLAVVAITVALLLTLATRKAQ
jgi:hypothetical protein